MEFIDTEGTDFKGKFCSGSCCLDNTNNKVRNGVLVYGGGDIANGYISRYYCKECFKREFENIK